MQHDPQDRAPGISVSSWFRSSYSGENGGNCIEVAHVESGIAVRDSKDKEGPCLRFTAEAWRGLIDSVKPGDID
ncbi:DUF397 domain-containing protein [Kitasatospora sp. NPDC050463]|uniref:DUF397 domain-containing protein n=1 Tax=Kitasatospora sp. NPDC050463 TaxID=3155786 RepID=UPI0033F0F436